MYKLYHLELFKSRNTIEFVDPLVSRFTKSVIVLLMCAGLSACSSSTSQNIPSHVSVKEQIAGLHIVDCLLPGQLRSLGQTTYLTPRRPINTTAADCNIRGGEFVAYDRADYKSSLNVWLPAAEAGDAQAQVNVGEIFERGTNGEPNYAAAAIWYEKAAQQGNRQGLFNLGTFYEQGLGVKKDSVKSLNLYRQAWGLPEDSVMYQSVARAQQAQLKNRESELTDQRDALRNQLNNELQQKDTKIQTLQKQIQQLREQSESSQQDLENTEQNTINESAYTQQEEEIKELKQLVTELQTDSSSDEELLALQNNIQLLDEKYQVSLLEIDKQKAQRAGYAKQKQEIIELKKLVTDLQAEQGSAEDIQVLQSKIQKQEDKYATALQELEGKKVIESGYAKQIQQIDELKILVADLQADTGSAEEIQVLQNKIQLLDDKYKLALQDLKNQKAKESSYADQQQNQKKQLDELNLVVAKLESERAKTEEKINELPLLREPVTRPPRKDVQQKLARQVKSQNINFGRFYALVIGNQEYQSIDNLTTTENDARKMAEVLKKRYGFQVELLINADNLTVMDTINNLNKKLTEEDNLLIYYAGHGSRVRTGQQEDGYWLPVNADPPPVDSFWVSNEFITSHLARYKAKRVLVVADSCYAGLLSTSPGYLYFNEDVQQDLDYVRYKLPRRARLLITSGGDRPVIDSGGQGHSVFARVLLDTLEENNDIISAPKLFLSIKEKVKQMALANKFVQTPNFKSIKGAGHEVGDFFFVPKGS